MRLTDQTVRSLPLPIQGQKLYRDETLPGFACRVSQGGARTFILVYGESRNFLTIGRYPIITLSEARTEAKRFLAERTLGKIRPQAITFPQAVKLFLEEKRKSRRTRTADDYEYYLDRFFPFRGQLSEVSHAEVLRKLNAIKSTAVYNHALAAARGFFNWCHKRRYISENPVTGISGRRTKTRDRVLEDAELKRIWLACEDQDNELPASFRRIVKLLMLTGQRRTEVASFAGEFFADGRCTLPEELCKNGREHTFPLGTTAALIVGNAEPGLLVPARGRTTPFNGWSKAKAQLDKASGTADWTLHDLRRTFATRLSEMGVAPHVVERLLNHITGQISGVAAIYNRATYQEEMRQAIQLWEAHLQTVLQN